VTSETIDHSTLARLVEAHAVRATHIIGQPGGWSVIVKYGMTERPLAATRSREVRLFRKFETLVGYLKDIGISRFDLDAANYDPQGGSTRRTRPDTSAALKRAHAASAHAQWVAEKVQASLSDLRPNVPHEDVMRQAQALINKKRKQHARKASA